MEFKVRVRGVDRHVRTLAVQNKKTYEAAIDGVLKAAQYLLERVRAKFGTYQSTGGKPGGRGPWPKLRWETIQRKVRRYGSNKGPLIGSGDMQDSFTVVRGGKGRISASVGSDDPKLVHHVYGAPRAGVPQRDPIVVTAKEERDNCNRIIEDEITSAYKGGDI